MCVYNSSTCLCKAYQLDRFWSDFSSGIIRFKFFAQFPSVLSKHPGFTVSPRAISEPTEPEVFLIHSNHHLHTNGKPLPPHIVQQPGQDDEGGEDFSDVDETFKQNKLEGFDLVDAQMIYKDLECVPKCFRISRPTALNQGTFFISNPCHELLLEVGWSWWSVSWNTVDGRNAASVDR